MNSCGPWKPTGMNIINKGFLKLALLPAGIYSRMGVNLDQLRSILHVKLIMDDRRPNSIQQSRRQKNAKPISTATLGTMLLSALMGFLYLFSFIIGQDIVTHLSFYFSFFFFMLSATLISDFTSVLIDIRDNTIILPKPVNDSTVIVARLLHIFIHICKIVVPMSLPGLVMMFVEYGPGGGLLFFLLVFFVTLFSIFFINAVYILILRITTPEKFQSIISYIQIIFAIVIYASYQVLPRMINHFNLEQFDIAKQKGIELFPIYWFALAWKVLYSWQGSMMQVVLAIAGIFLPFVSLYLVIRYLAPTFNNKLAMINTSGASPSAKPATARTIKSRGSYSRFLGHLLTRGNAERMGFLFTWKMTARSRDFKMKVYPSAGYLLVYVVIMFLNNRELTLDDLGQEGQAGKILVISSLYFTSLLLTMALGQIIYSEKYKASWIYYTSPLHKPGTVILGAAKAAIFRFYIPLVIFILAAGIVLVGPRVIPNIILGLFNVLLIATVMVYVGYKRFPFSQHQNTDHKMGSFFRGLMVLFISGLIALGHFLIYEFTAAVILCALLSILATWLMMGSVRNISWEAIRSSYRDE
jgi:ABC-2 type transport system permease protein